MQRKLCLRKNGHDFVFKYPAGKEHQIIDIFAEMAASSDTSFDWYDAAVLSYQMGRKLEKDFKNVK